MKRSVVVLAVTASVVVSPGVLAACSSSPEDPAEALAGRVTALLEEGEVEVLDRLAQSGLELSPSDLQAVGGDDVTCPRVTSPVPGDRATCRVVVGGVELEVDVEFGEDDAVDLVAVAVAP